MALLAHALKPFHPRVCLIAPPYAIVGGTLTARRLWCSTPLVAARPPLRRLRAIPFPRMAQDSGPLGMKGGV